jgi:hypothetical protein
MQQFSNLPSCRPEYWGGGDDTGLHGKGSVPTDKESTSSKSTSVLAPEFSKPSTQPENS